MPNQALSLWLHAVVAAASGEQLEANAAIRMLHDIEAEAPLAKHVRRIERLFAGDPIATEATEAFRGAWTRQGEAHP